MKHEHEEYKIVMPFVDESDSFTNGFECGQIWEQMKFGMTINRMVHKTNKEQIEMMAAKNNYIAYLDNVSDEWMQFKGIPTNPITSQAPH